VKINQARMELPPPPSNNEDEDEANSPSAEQAAPPVQPQKLTPRDQMLETRIRDNANDAEAWEELVSRLHLVSIDRGRFVADRIVDKYPMSGWAWVKYAEMEEAAGHEERVKDILARALYSCFSVELWSFYLAWLSRTTRGDKARSTMLDAFEEAIKPKNVGCAMDASLVWRSYLDFLLSEPDETQFEKAQKTNLLRKAYQRATEVPIRGIDAVWREYTLFEQKQASAASSTTSTSTSKKILDEHSPKYTHASEVLKERETYWRAVLPPVGSRPTHALPRTYTRTAQEQAKLQAWLGVVTYERTNPEHLGMVDFKLRVRLAFRHALQELYFYPEVWYAFAEFERSVSDPEACLTILRASLQALPDSTLLGFALADALEVDAKLDEAKAVHESLVRRIRNSSVAYCQLIRFVRRTEGVASARAMFKRARESESGDAMVYCTAAQIELFANKSAQTCRNVFELGLRRFPNDVVLYNAYLDAVETMNDDSAARDVYERAVDALGASSDDALHVWERYRTFTRDRMRDGGDLQALSLIEQRMADLFKSRVELTGLLGVTHRYAASWSAVASSSGTDAGFFERFAGALHHGGGGGTSNGSSRASTRGGSHARDSGSTASSTNTQHLTTEGDLEGVPLFLRKLVAMLPRKSAIASMDVDFVLRSLSKATLPPPPVVRAVDPYASSSGDLLLGGNEYSLEGSRKKVRLDEELGAQGAPVDAFKQRHQVGLKDKA
jgi:hypothetical protein